MPVFLQETWTIGMLVNFSSNNIFAFAVFDFELSFFLSVLELIDRLCFFMDVLINFFRLLASQFFPSVSYDFGVDRRFLH